MRLKCKLAYEGVTWHFKTDVECDKYFFTLKKDKWYEIEFVPNSYGIRINPTTIVYDAEYFIKRHFYTVSELRKQKIKTLLNGEN